MTGDTHKMADKRNAPIIGLKPDWVMVALPTAMAIRVLNGQASVLIITCLIATAFMRQSAGRIHVNSGPLLLLLFSSVIVISRPGTSYFPILPLLFGILVVRLTLTVDARRLIASLIDGLGLYLLASALLALAGIRSPAERPGLIESTGFTRTFFPLTYGLSAPSSIAGAYLVGAIFLSREIGWLRRLMRIICIMAAIYVIVGVGSRTALAVTAVIACVALLLPSASRWIAQAATLLSAVSAYVLPSVFNAAGFLIAPLNALAPGRDTTAEGVLSLQGRQYIWEGSIKYWNEHINDLADLVLGFGESGQYRSGASSTYRNIVIGLGPNPELITVHNSFLQQLFDGGILGWLLMALSVYWASARLSNRRREWGHWAASAIFAMTVVLLCNTTETAMAPGVFAESFWVIVILVGIACQAGDGRPDDKLVPPARGAAFAEDNPG